MIVKLLTEHHLEFLSLKKGCRGSSEATLVKMSICWKSHAAAHTCMFVFFSSSSPLFTGCEDADHCGVPIRDMLDAPADLWCALRNIRRNQQVSVVVFFLFFNFKLSLLNSDEAGI